jgi:DNA end-binding protein Ku
MAPRAYWTGNIKISLVSVGVRLYNAVSEAEKVRLNQVHKGCNSRIKMPTTCPVHGQVDRSEIAKAYEFEKDKYVIIEQEELDKIKLRSEKTIELTKFVPLDSVDEVYLDSAYYVAPDGPINEEPFRVFRTAMEEAGMGGIGKLTMTGRERPVLIRPGEKGFTLNTLYSANEVRDATPYFEEIKEGGVNKDYMQLATSLIKGKAGEFDPKEFRDTYQDALVELVKAKVAGQTPIIIQEDDLPATFNFADALRQSLQAVGPAEAEATKAGGAAAAVTKKKAGAKKPPAASEPAPAKKVARRKQA